MAMADDFIVLFLGLETLSIAAYVLSAMHLRRAQSQEAGLKYFVLGGFSSAFLLYGIALIYGGTGIHQLHRHPQLLRRRACRPSGTAVPGHVPIHGGLHPDRPGAAARRPRLQGRRRAVPLLEPRRLRRRAHPVGGLHGRRGQGRVPSPPSIRVFVLTFPNYVTDWRPIVIALAVLSMFVGSVLAIVQTNVKRMLAYSSINHAGFILMAVAASSSAGTAALLFYLAAYTFMVAGSFGVVSLVSGRGDSRHRALRLPGPARGPTRCWPATFVVFLLAQAGVPFTSGLLRQVLGDRRRRRRQALLAGRRSPWSPR